MHPSIETLLADIAEEQTDATEDVSDVDDEFEDSLAGFRQRLDCITGCGENGPCNNACRLKRLVPNVSKDWLQSLKIKCAHDC